MGGKAKKCWICETSFSLDVQSMKEINLCVGEYTYEMGKACPEIESSQGWTAWCKECSEEYLECCSKCFPQGCTGVHNGEFYFSITNSDYYHPFCSVCGHDKSPMLPSNM